MSQIGALYIRDYPAWVHTIGAQQPHGLAVYTGKHIVAVDEILQGAGLEHRTLLERARHEFPRSRFIPRNGTRERVVRDQLLQRLYTQTPEILDLNDSWILFRLQRNTEITPLVQHLKIRCGVADNPLHARLAALTAPTGGVKQVHDAKALRTFVPVSGLSEFGFEPELCEKLQLFGFRTVESLHRLTKRQLHAQFGMEGKRLYGLLHESAQPIPEWIPPQAVTAVVTFQAPVCEPYQWEAALKDLARSVVSELGHRLTSTVTVIVDGKKSTRLLREPTAQEYTIRHHAFDMALSLIRPNTPAVKITLECSGLGASVATQLDIFAPPLPRLEQAVQSITRRHPDRLVKVSRIEEHAPLPEDRIRYESVTTG